MEQEEVTPGPAGMSLDELEKRVEELGKVRSNLKKGDKEGVNQVKSEYRLLRLSLDDWKKKRVVTMLSSPGDTCSR